MTRKSSAAALTWLVLAWSAAVHATEVVSVGRVDMQLPGEGWQSLAVPDQGNEFSGSGVTQRQQTETRLLWRRAPDQTIDPFDSVWAKLPVLDLSIAGASSHTN
jgi:hypothetical protein